MRALSIKNPGYVGSLQSVIDQILSITGLSAYHDITDGSTITKDGSNNVTVINDKSGNSKNFVAVSGAGSPVYNSGSPAYIQFSSANKLEIVTIAVGQPVTIYLVASFPSLASVGTVFADFGNTNQVQSQQIYLNATDGSTAYYPVMVSSNGQPNLLSTFPTSDSANVNIIKLEYNGATSKLTYGKDFPYTLSHSTSGITTLRLQNNIRFYGLVVVSGVVSAANNTIINNALNAKFSCPTYDYIINFGDSVTEGFNSSRNTLAYAYLTAKELSKRYHNFGVAGTYVQSTGGGGQANSLQVVSTKGLVDGVNHGWVTFCYGLNDDYTSSPSAWKTAYKAEIQKFIDYGYSLSKIIIQSPPPAPSRTSYLQALRSTVQDIAYEMGIVFADQYYAFTDLGGVFDTDNLHPTDVGHRKMADYLKTVISGSPYAQPAPPTSVVVDDTPGVKTMNWTNNPSFTALSDYEYSVDTEATWAVVTAKPIVVGDNAKAIGQVAVRVKRLTNTSPSRSLRNNVAITASAKLTPIGTYGSTYYQQGSTTTYSHANIIDGNVSTFYGGNGGSVDQYVGVDLGAAHLLTKVRVYPRGGFGSRITGCIIEGSNTSSIASFTSLNTISSTPPDGQFTEYTVSGSYRWVRLRLPYTGTSITVDLAEMEVYGY